MLRILGCTVLGCAVLCLASCGGRNASTTGTVHRNPPTPGVKDQTEKEEAGAKGALVTEDKLVGTWEVVKTESDAPKGATLEFTKDGKFKVKMGPKGPSMEGNYKIEGDKIVQSATVNGKEMKESATVTKLTDTELVTKDEKGKTDEFKKVK
jgi:uncharacterized protein (TIGR03066 family)